MDAGEVAQDLGQAALHEILGRAEPHPPAQFRDGEILPGAFVGFEDAPGQAEHRLAVRGQRHRMGVAHKEPPRCRLFEPSDMLTDGRLAQPEAAPGLAKARGLGDGHKGGQQRGVEHGIIAFRDDSNIGDRASQ